MQKNRMIKKFKKIFRKTIGIMLIVLGIAGLFLPILQGVLLIIAGLFFLEYEPINRLIHRLKERWSEWRAGKKKPMKGRK